MKKPAIIAIPICVFVLAAASAFAGVTVSSPTNGSTVGTSVNFVASSSTSCSKGVASMGIYPTPYQLAYTVNGANLKTSLNFNPGTYNVVVEEWDYCGGATTKTVSITVKTGQSAVYVSAPANHSTVEFADELCCYRDDHLFAGGGLHGDLHRAESTGVCGEWRQPQYQSDAECRNLQCDGGGVG